MRPAVRSALDQAGAASAEATEVLTRLGELMGAEPRPGRPGFPTARVLRKLADRAAEGRLNRCAHLRPGAPAHWAAWRPGSLRCLECLRRAADAVHGTRDAFTCDACRRVDRSVGFVVGAVAVPPVVLDLGDGVPHTDPPVTSYFGLCGRCARREAETEGGTP